MSEENKQYCFKLDGNKITTLNKLPYEIVKKWVDANKSTNCEELLKVFPKDIQGASGVFICEEEYNNISNEREKNKRWHKEPIEIDNGKKKIYVSTQWGGPTQKNPHGNKDNILQKAKDLEYNIEECNNIKSSSTNISDKKENNPKGKSDMPKNNHIMALKIKTAIQLN